MIDRLWCFPTEDVQIVIRIFPKRPCARRTAAPAVGRSAEAFSSASWARDTPCTARRLHRDIMIELELHDVQGELDTGSLATCGIYRRRNMHLGPVAQDNGP